MKNPRKFLRACIAISVLAAMALGIGCKNNSWSEKQSDAPGSPKQEFHLGVQAWIFNNMTFVEMLDEMDRLGIRYLQCYRKQKLGEGFGKDELFNHEMKPTTRRKVLSLLKKKNITLASYGVISGKGWEKDMEEWRRIFEFAKEMGMRDIAIEPKMEFWPEVLPGIAKLAKQYGIGVGIHNHANPNSPSDYMEKLKNYDAVIKLSPDTGHWARSGFDPVDGLKTTKGRIQSVHIKDLTGMKPAGVQDSSQKFHELPWGTGALNFAGQLLELRRQGFDGIVYLEYEHFTRDFPDEIALCVNYYRRAEKATDDELLKNAVLPQGYTSVEKVTDIKRKHDAGLWSQRPVPLFKDDLSNADFQSGSWTIKDGTLSPVATIVESRETDSNIWTKEDYGNFALAGEFKCAEKTDSGILIRCSDTRDWRQNAIEFQIFQGDTENPNHLVGAMFDCQEPGRQIEITPGEWYRFVLIAQDGELNFYLNGEHLNRIRLKKWTEAGKNPDGSSNKFTKACKDMPKSGKIGFQGGTPIEFRKLTIEKF